MEDDRKRREGKSENCHQIIRWDPPYPLQSIGPRAKDRCSALPLSAHSSLSKARQTEKNPTLSRQDAKRCVATCLLSRCTLCVHVRTLGWCLDEKVSSTKNRSTLAKERRQGSKWTRDLQRGSSRGGALTRTERGLRVERAGASGRAPWQKKLDSVSGEQCEGCKKRGPSKKEVRVQRPKVGHEARMQRLSVSGYCTGAPRVVSLGDSMLKAADSLPYLAVELFRPGHSDHLLLSSSSSKRHERRSSSDM
jgi:hypothetical protein